MLDNSKALLIFLVVYGHFLYYNYQRESDDWRTWLSGDVEMMEYLFLIFRVFPIPMFVFISGVLSQGPVTKQRLRRFLTNLVIPTVVWVLFAKQFVLGLLTDPRPSVMWQALWALGHLQRFEVRGYEWFLWALIMWRGSIFVLWAHLRPWACFTIALAVSCVAGYKDISFANGPVALLPYFVAGYVFPLDSASRATESLQRPLQAAVGVVVLFWLFVGQPLVFQEPLPDAYGNFSCCEAGAIFEGIGGADRALYWARKLAKVAVDILILLAIMLFMVPRVKTPFSFVGQYCLYPYLFHGIALLWRDYLVRAFPPPEVTSTWGHAAVLLLHVPFVLAVCAGFASLPWRCLLSLVFEPVWIAPVLRPLFQLSKKKPLPKGSAALAHAATHAPTAACPRGAPNMA